MLRPGLAVVLAVFGSCLPGMGEAIAAEAQGRFVPGAVPGTVRFAGSETSFGIGGRLESHAVLGDVHYEESQAGRDRLRFSQIPVERDDKRSQFRFNSRDSRLWLRLQRPVQNHDLNIYVETEFTDKPGTYAMFVRHAYLSVGPLLAGRSYTTFIDSAALPDVDTGSGPGEVFLKRGQLRWSQGFGNGMELALALEESDSVINDPVSKQTRTIEDDQVPTIVSRLAWRDDWGQLSIATMIRKLRWQQERTRVSELAGAIGVSGRLNVGAVNNMRFMVNYGNSIGRFITLGAYADASLDSHYSELNTHPAFAAQLAYQHFWNAAWRSTVSVGWSQSNSPEGVSALLTERAGSIQANLFWSPVPELSVGFEYLHASQQLRNGQDGELNRFMFSTRYTLEL